MTRGSVGLRNEPSTMPKEPIECPRPSDHQRSRHDAVASSRPAVRGTRARRPAADRQHLPGARLPRGRGARSRGRPGQRTAGVAGGLRPSCPRAARRQPTTHPDLRGGRPHRRAGRAPRAPSGSRSSPTADPCAPS
jgi:hypothetical protein